MGREGTERIPEGVGVPTKGRRWEEFGVGLKDPRGNDGQ